MVPAERTLWRIGDRGRGVEQVAGGPLFSDGVDEVVFRVGHDDLATAWPRLHPGPLAASTGWAGKSITVVFDLDAAPAGWCELRLRVLASQGPCPDLEVCVNGRRALHLLDPVRTDRSDVGVTSPIAAWSRTRLSIPGDALHQGENRLVLTTVQLDPAEPEERVPTHPVYPWFWGSSLQYGELELVDIGAADPPPASARLVPQPLYVRTDEGLAELVDVVVSAPIGFAHGEVALATADRCLRSPLDLEGRDFGDVRVRLCLPDPGHDAIPATLTLSVDGTTTTTPTTLQPCRRWTVHVLPHVHLDLGYTDYQGKVTEVHTRNLDRVVAVLRDTPDYAYSIDGSYVVEQYLRSRSEASTTTVLDTLRGGRMSVNAFYALFLSGIASLEECYRSAYHAARLRREQGVRVDYANLTDVPSYSHALPSIVRALGLDAFVGIQNHGRAATEDSDALHLLSPFRWRGPDGAEVLAVVADCYAQLRYICGHPPTIAGCAQTLGRLLARYDRPDYLPRDLPVVGIYSDNEDLGDGEAALVARWNRRYAYPRLRYSTLSEYLDTVRPLFAELPVVCGDGGSYWEDGVGSDAVLMSTYRRAQSLLGAVETLAALVSARDPGLRAATAELDRAWDGLLVGSEHTWSSMHAQSSPHSHQQADQLAWKRHHVATAARIADDELHRTLSQLGELVTTAGPSLLVANSLSWARDGEVELELPAGTTVVDDDGAALPARLLRRLDGVDAVRVRVGPVPAFGCRRFALRAGVRSVDAASLADAAVPEVVESSRWRMRLDGGRIVGLQHRASGRELVGSAAPGWGLAEVLRVTGGDALDGTGPRTSLHDFSRTRPQPDLHVTAAQMRAVATSATPCGVAVLFAGSAPTLPAITTEVELRDDDSVRVAVRLRKLETEERESVYVAFPFALDRPRLHYDRQVGWVDPARDHTPGACNEWFTTQHAVVLADDRTAVTWASADAPLFCVGDVVRGRWPREFGPPSGVLLSWVMNNHWWTNYPSRQQGELELRYAFRVSDSADLAAAARVGRELRTPLLAASVGWLDKMDTAPRPLGAGGALVELDCDDSMLVTLASARTGDGMIARLQETAGRPARMRLRHPAGAAGRAATCTATEDDLEPLTVDSDGWVAVELGAYAVATIRLAIT